MGNLSKLVRVIIFCLVALMVSGVFTFIISLGLYLLKGVPIKDAFSEYYSLVLIVILFGEIIHREFYRSSEF